jgi:hypothetical protein
MSCPRWRESSKKRENLTPKSILCEQPLQRQSANVDDDPKPPLPRWLLGSHPHDSNLPWPQALDTECATPADETA